MPLPPVSPGDEDESRGWLDRSRNAPALPADDPDPKARAAAIADARDVYRYNFGILSPFPLVDRVPFADKPTPAWLATVMKIALGVKANRIAIRYALSDEEGSRGYEPASGDDGGDDERFQLLLERVARGEDDGGDGGDGRGAGDGAPSEADLIREAEDRIGSISPVLLCRESQGPVPLDDDDDDGRGLRNVLLDRGPHGRAPSLQSFKDLCLKIALIPVAEEIEDDDAFARMRVAGFNPLVIRGVADLPDHFPVGDAAYRRVMGEGDSLDAAAAEGRLFLADYETLGMLENAKRREDGAPKYVYAPLALFAVPRGGKRLKPVAIQCEQDPDAECNPVFTPNGDRWHWAMAKSVVQVADAYHHELVSHLGRTHLFVAPFVLAMHHELAPSHPLNVLLRPHFEGTLYINDMAAHNLIAKGGDIDQIFAGTIESSQKLAAAAFAGADFKGSMLPKLLETRRVADASVLGDYPYRDDGLRVWGAIRGWVAEYLGHYYHGSDAAVSDDAELQAFSARLTPPSPFACPGFEPPRTLAELVDAVTLIVFTASAQHAVVNFPQLDYMTYAPLVSGALWDTAPRRDTPATLERWLAMLPPIELAERQLHTLVQLGGVYYSRIGDYRGNWTPGPAWFKDAPVVNEMLPRFQERLRGVESAIAGLNADPVARARPYPFLLPSRIPQSINI